MKRKKKRNKNKSKPQKQNLMPIYILATVTAVMLIVMFAVLNIPQKKVIGDFVPPDFDSTAIQGIPEVPKELGYSSPYQPGMAYRFSVCFKVKLSGKMATVYLTNNADNEVYLKLRILDSKGKILGETGLIKPGEYVKDVELSKALAVGTPIKLKIMSYEPDTYNSMGSVSIIPQLENE